MRRGRPSTRPRRSVGKVDSARRANCRADVDVLRARPWSESCRAQVERGDGSSSESAGSGYGPSLSLRALALTLLAVPGGQSATSDKFDGPSGVLVCAEDYIIYKHQGAKEHRVPIPKRAHPLSDLSRGLIITSAVMHKMKVRDLAHQGVQLTLRSRVPSSSCCSPRRVICTRSRSNTRRRRSWRSRSSTSTPSPSRLPSASSSRDSCLSRPSLGISTSTNSKSWATTTTRRSSPRPTTTTLAPELTPSPLPPSVLARWRTSCSRTSLTP